METREIDGIIEQHGGRESAILAILQDIQAKDKYLQKEALEYVSEKMNIPLVQVFRIATFYNALSLKPRGRHRVDVCLGTACHVRGGIRSWTRWRGIYISRWERQLKINASHWNRFIVSAAAAWDPWL